jgi:hypothetical protein
MLWRSLHSTLGRRMPTANQTFKRYRDPTFEQKRLREIASTIGVATTSRGRPPSLAVAPGAHLGGGLQPTGRRRKAPDPRMERNDTPKFIQTIEFTLLVDTSNMISIEDMNYHKSLIAKE